MILIYFINSTLCAALLYTVYLIVLEKESMHNFKRAYLLVSLVFSLIVPLVAINISIPFIAEIFQSFPSQFIEIDYNNAEYSNMFLASSTNAHAVNYSLSYKHVIFILYVLITLVLLLRLARNFIKMILFAKRNKLTYYGKLKIILTKEKLVPHSFLNYIFVNEEDYHNGKIDNSILVHEATHIKQKHTLDVIFTELLIAFFWFNPMLYFFKSKIKQNHEFLADKAVINKDANIKQYQILLVNSTSQQVNIKLASNINYSLTKKRLFMMTKTTSRLAGICRQIAIIPMFFAALCVFSSKSVAQNVPTPIPQQQSGSVVSDSIKKEDGKVKAETKSTNTDKAIPFSEVEEPIKFQGSDAQTFVKWANIHIVYPATAMTAGTQGKLVVEFTVDADGKVKDVEVVQSVHPSLDAEAVRVIKSSSAWAGKQKDKPIAVIFTCPIDFQMTSPATSSEELKTN